MNYHLLLIIKYQSNNQKIHSFSGGVFLDRVNYKRYWFSF